MISFIDESGDHNLELEKLDNLYNVFVLGAVIFRDDEHAKFDRKFRQLKSDIFGGEDYIVHTAEIIRPSKAIDSRTQQFSGRKFRHDFYTSVNRLIEETEFEIAACVIRKEQMVYRYGANAEDPYAFCFENVLNRILFACGSNGECKIFPEKRTHPEDVKLELNFLKMKTMGTKFFRGAEIDQMIDEFTLKDKKSNLSGLQLADLVVSPIGRHIIGKKPRVAGNEVPYALVKTKFRPRSFTIFP